MVDRLCLDKYKILNPKDEEALDRPKWIAAIRGAKPATIRNKCIVASHYYSLNLFWSSLSWSAHAKINILAFWARIWAFYFLYLPYFADKYLTTLERTLTRQWMSKHCRIYGNQWSGMVRSDTRNWLREEVHLNTQLPKNRYFYFY